MADQNQNQGNGLDEMIGAADKVKGAVKTGKAIANILKGAATGGVHGAAIGAAKSVGKQAIIIGTCLLVLPVLFLAMLPQAIFGWLFGDFSTTDTNIMNDNAAIVENISIINNSVTEILYEGYSATLETVRNLAASHAYSEIVDEVGGNIVFDGNNIICWYSASQDQSVDNINISHLTGMVRPHKDELYYYEQTIESRTIQVDDGEGGTTSETVTFYIYTLKYRGDVYFPSNVFTLTDDQLSLAGDYAMNLTIFLYDSFEASANGTHATITELLVGDETPLEDGVFGNPFPGNDWSGIISSYFGSRPYPGVGNANQVNNHTGIDIAFGAGTDIHAVMGGTVLFVRDSGSSGYGKHIAINHGGGYVTLYAHCSKIVVSQGARVEAGQKIAEVGQTGWSTGPHLHIEVILNGVPQNPLEYLSNG